MTYQVTMRGCDGVLIASDRRELSSYDTASVPTRNDVVKIRVSPDGRFAWAYSGNEIGAIYSARIGKAFEDISPASDEEVRKILADCGLAAIREWQQSASGAAGPIDPVVVLASGQTRKIFRAIARPTTEPQEMMRGMCVSGQTNNWAAYLPERLYSSNMPVDELLWLAASSIRIAHEFANLLVDRLDIAIHRDSGARFELIDGDQYWQETTEFSKRIDASVREALREQARTRPIK